MIVTLPLRITSAMKAGIARTKLVRTTVRRHGRRRAVRRRVTVLLPSGRVALGRPVQIAGSLTNTDGQGIAGAEIDVWSSTPTSDQRLAAVFHTDDAGRYRYTATASSSRTLRFVYAGSALILPAERDVTLRVPATSSLRVSPTHVLNGQAVVFRGRVRARPVPPSGKLVELQVLLSGRWQTFRTTTTDRTGRWAIRYQFLRTRGDQAFQFRVVVPAEAGYAFETGDSRSVSVRVRGPS